jgi:hypothetical protein
MLKKLVKYLDKSTNMLEWTQTITLNQDFSFLVRARTYQKPINLLSFLWKSFKKNNQLFWIMKIMFLRFLILITLVSILPVDTLAQEKSPSVKVSKSVAKTSKKSSKKPRKKIDKNACPRGIHRGEPKCHVKSGHINAVNIHTGKRVKDLALTTASGGLTKEGRKKMLELLSDPKTKQKCPYGYTFNFNYQGSASWRMYDCYVQDRLIAYLYRVAHHFDSDVQIVSALRANERKTSRHHNGHAVDFKIVGVPAKEVFEYCKNHFPLVGIGYYPTTGFVHLDVGREDEQAFWVDTSGSGDDANYQSGVSQEQKGVAKDAQPRMIKTIEKQLNKNYEAFKKQKAALIAKEERKKRLAEKKKQAQKKKSKQKPSNKKPSDQKSSDKKPSEKNPAK